MADLAIATEGIAAAPGGRFRPIAGLAAAFAAEGERHVLWLAVFFATGIALYFTLTVEPPSGIGIVAMLAAAGGAVMLRRWPPARDAAIVLAFVGAGFAVMQQACGERGTPMLQRRIGPVALSGRVIDIDAVERGWRVVLAPDPIPGLTAREQPHRVRP